MGGYLDLFGIRDWYFSQPKAIRQFLYRSCGYGINTDSKRLLFGEISVIDDPEDPYPWTATKFLCNHAVTALPSTITPRTAF